jgi:hypothetical protein
VQGSYTVLDGLHFSGLHSLEIGGSHNVVRNSTSVGTKADPTGAAIYVDGTDCLVWRNRVTDHGDKTAQVDTDAHGISVVRPAQRTWILENESARNAGDGINVNPYPYDAQTWSAIGFVYIGRNVSHDNKQTGIWTKGSHDIIVSQNETYGHVSDPQGFSNGAGIGNQYSPQLAWYLYNNIHDNTVGFTVGGGLDNAAFADPAPKTLINAFIGNILSRITGTDECGQGAVWACAPFFLTGPGQYLLQSNTVQQAGDAVHVTRAAGFSMFNAIGASNVVNEGVGPVTGSSPLTATSATDGFRATYGLDVTNGRAPGDGSVGPGALSAPPPVVVVPPPVVTPPPPVSPPPPVKTLPACSSNALIAFFQRLLGRCS